MESLLPYSFSRISRRRRNIILACCAIGAAGGYVSYRVYTSPSVARKRLQLCRFFQSISSLLESAAQGSDCVGLLWKDLHSFLLSNEDEVPQSLKQLLKVGQTREFQTSVALLCKSVTQGVVSSLKSEQGRGSPSLWQEQDGADYGSALFEELSSSQNCFGRKIGKAGRDLGRRESFRKERRRRSGGESDVSQLSKDVGEDDHNGLEFRRGKLVRSESAPRIVEGRESYLWGRGEEDEAGRYQSWSNCKPLAGAHIAETSSGSGGGKGKFTTFPSKRRESAVRGGREEGLCERLAGKFFSEPGRGFTSVVVASATRSLVLSVLEGMNEMNLTRETKEADVVVSEADTPKKPSTSSRAASGTVQDRIISFLCSSKGKSLVADCIETFIGTAVSVYLDKTKDVNVCEDILSAVSSPAHRDSVKDLLTSVCNGALETLIRASHDVYSVGSSSSAVPLRQSDAPPTELGVGTRRDVRRLTLSLGKSSSFNQLGEHSDVGDSTECGHCQGGGHDHLAPGSPPPWSSDSHDSESLSLSGLRSTRIAFDESPQREQKTPVHDLDRIPILSSSSSSQIDGNPENSKGWIEGVSRTLAVPSNRALVLDVAGTVTAEAVRSTIDVMLSKVSLTVRGMAEKGSASERNSGSSKVLRVINKTGELAQATASRALIAMSMCLAICLHTLLGQSTVLEHAMSRIGPFFTYRWESRPTSGYQMHVAPEVGVVVSPPMPAALSRTT